MSEPIQSISQGTYMIGETTQTEFEAGPGISITQPSEGTVRIANDETVLWTGEQYVISSTNTSLLLSEAATNFEKLRIYVIGSAQVGGVTPIDIVPVSDTSAYYGLSVSYANDTSNTVFIDCCILQIDGTSFKVSKGFRKAIGSGILSDTNRGPTVIKIVGINRISGGNT